MTDDDKTPKTPAEEKFYLRGLLAPVNKRISEYGEKLADFSQETLTLLGKLSQEYDTVLQPVCQDVIASTYKEFRNSLSMEDIYDHTQMRLLENVWYQKDTERFKNLRS